MAVYEETNLKAYYSCVTYCHKIYYKQLATNDYDNCQRTCQLQQKKRVYTNAELHVSQYETICEP
jgi:hypothetical protein